jgi:hypothetical protein
VTYRRRCRALIMLWLAMLALPAAAIAQVQTEVPAPVAGAKPVTVERIKVRGTALEGNLEGNAVDRDVLVFLPPSYAKGEVTPLPQNHVLPFFDRTLCHVTACR